MAEARPPVPVLLVAAVFSRHADALSWARDRLEEAYGPVERVSPPFVFDQTDYYAGAMGTDLRKQFLVFRELVSPDRLAEIKLHANALERDLAGSGQHAEARPVNIDPGYLNLGKFLLATTKDQAHRVYLGKGIYAEATLRFEAGAFTPWPWTYADYRQPAVLEFLREVRASYHDRLRAARTGRGSVAASCQGVRHDAAHSNQGRPSAAGRRRTDRAAGRSGGPLFRAGPARPAWRRGRALLTARMLAPGEDPGMLLPTSGPTNLLLPLLWFLAAVGLAGWRLASRRGEWRGGVVEAALLLAALLTFVAAEMAGYKHPARIIAWDGLTLFLVVCLVRQLAVRAGRPPGVVRRPAGRRRVAVRAGRLSGRRPPAGVGHVRPAGAVRRLAGALPAGPVRRGGRLSSPPRRPLANHLDGSFRLCRSGRVGRGRAVRIHPTGLDAAAGGPVGRDGQIDRGPPSRRRPRQLLRAFPLFQPPGGAAVVADPHNFILEIAATCGVFTLLAVLAALGAFFVKAGALAPQAGGGRRRRAGTRAE